MNESFETNVLNLCIFMRTENKLPKMYGVDEKEYSLSIFLEEFLHKINSGEISPEEHKCIYSIFKDRFRYYYIMLNGNRLLEAINMVMNIMGGKCPKPQLFTQNHYEYLKNILLIKKAHDMYLLSPKYYGYLKQLGFNFDSLYQVEN